jgi:hypothetical protein
MAKACGCKEKGSYTFSREAVYRPSSTRRHDDGTINYRIDLVTAEGNPNELGGIAFLVGPEVLSKTSQHLYFLQKMFIVGYKMALLILKKGRKWN